MKMKKNDFLDIVEIIDGEAQERGIKLLADAIVSHNKRILASLEEGISEDREKEIYGSLMAFNEVNAFVRDFVAERYGRLPSHE